MSDTSSLHRRIYAVLKTFLNGATEQELTSEFKYFAGYDIPFENYGFTSLTDFMATAPNLYQIKCDVEGSLLYIAKSDGQSSLVENIVNRERCKDYYKRSQYCCDYAPPKRNANAASSPSERAITETETNPIEEIEQLEEQQLSLIPDNSTVATIKKMGPSDVFSVLREMKNFRETFSYADLGHYIHPYEMQIRCYATFQTQFPASILHIETPSLFSLFPRSFDNERCCMTQTLFESVAHMDPVFMNEIYCGKLYAVMCREMLCRCGLHACNAITVSFSFVRQLPVEFESMMALSIDCKLDGLGVSSDDGKWTDGTINYVKNALRDKLFNAIVKQHDDDSLEINSNLVEKGFASIL
ncbi:Tudor domain-containing protein [Trichinella spiralis]|uniref:Tudor domain-containing protein n=1 Tax=Trichinella spiralis TaxID=6334 RepID=A0ABR3KQD2_TRISP